MRGWRLWSVWGIAALGVCFWFNQPIRHALLLLLVRLVGESIPQWDGHSTAEYWLDTRAHDEYQISHVINARWVGSHDFDIVRIEDIPKDAKIVVYCSVGIRSQRIGKILIDSGYQQVSNLQGGIFKWMADGKPVVDMNNHSTDYVHPYDGLWGIFSPVGKWKRN